tara:strand:+ start:494 stop:736 length:243 start_codon:yes stop_codon:yes gene_type:complete
MSKGRPPSITPPPVVVVYRKREKGKVYMSVFENANVDLILNGKKHNPLIPSSYIIEEIGIGSFFIKEYQRSYKINKIKDL